MSTEDRLAKIEDTLGGPDGVNVRIARMEGEIAAHRAMSATQHEQIMAMLKFAPVPPESPKPDPKYVAAVIVFVILGLATAFGVGHQAMSSPVPPPTSTADQP